ncbi:hypothetical protein CPB84DRAFT_1765916 [Gymnopilus junonius]|uniref:Uncharacterized protein n=1 Tax=Gymnopilus junonius TaxID=109634 RepID=A0A9P5NU90_GYMJU|nr:hypothetical protein CPB84DRAFT_1765916 [Gymnopilus junonius]
MKSAPVHCAQEQWGFAVLMFSLCRIKFPPVPVISRLEMTKPLPAVTEPVSVSVAPGVVLLTTIDKLTQKHLIECDLYLKVIRLPKTGHPDAFYWHREHCPNRNKKKVVPNELRIKHHQVPVAPLTSQTTTSLSHLHVESPSQSPATSLFSKPTIHRPKLCQCPGLKFHGLQGQSGLHTHITSTRTTHSLGHQSDSIAKKILFIFELILV